LTFILLNGVEVKLLFYFVAGDDWFCCIFPVMFCSDYLFASNLIRLWLLN